MAKHSPRAFKRDFKELGQIIRNSGAQVVFSILPSTDSNENRGIPFINMWHHGWCHHENFGFFGDRKPYRAQSLLASDGIHLSQRGKRALGHELVGTH